MCIQTHTPRSSSVNCIGRAEVPVLKFEARNKINFSNSETRTVLLVFEF